MAGHGDEWSAVEACLNLSGDCRELLVREALNADDATQVMFGRFDCCLPEASEVGCSFWNAHSGMQCHWIL